MAKVFDVASNNEKGILKNMRLSDEAMEELMNRKPTIKIKDGVAQIDENQPDYKFWMED